MKLRTKLILMVGVVIVLFAAGHVAVDRYLVGPELAAMEYKAARKDMGRAVAGLQREIDAVDLLVRDWGYWDDTYEYVQGRKPDYVRSNLNDDACSVAGMNFIVIYDVSGRRVGGAMQDLEKEEAIDIAELGPTLAADSEFLVHHDVEAQFIGIRDTSHGPIMISCRPILTSEQAGPPAGTIMMGRFLDATRLDALRKQTGVSIALRRADTTGEPTSRPEGLPALVAEPYQVTVESDEQMQAQALLFNASGRPGWELEIHSPRDFAQGSRDAVAASGLIAVTALAVMLVLLLETLERTVVRPIRRLTTGVTQVNTGKDLSLRLPQKRRDEIGLLMGGFNKMAERLEREDCRRRESEQQLVNAKSLAEEANKAKSRFVATMSHELRTPLNGVLGMIDLALDTSLSGEQQEYLGMAKDSARLLLDAIGDVLDFSKIEAGKLDLDEVDMDIIEVVDQVVRALSAPAGAKGLSLTCCVAADVPRETRGDVVRIRQILTNLVGNALKFTDRGGVEVHVDVAARLEKAVDLHVAVSDTGVGISADGLQKVFHAFEQADGSTTRKFGGTGLGLTICAELVSLMNGRIWAESELGAGSTFHFIAQFPLGWQARGTHPGDERPQAAPAGRYRILLAEDNVVNQLVARKLLENLGHTVVVAATGLEVLAALDAVSFDMILMDVEMPEMDGLAAATEIRRIEQSTGRHVPIIAATAHVAKSDRDRCSAAGMDDYITKPISAEALADVIDTHLAGATTGQA